MEYRRYEEVLIKKMDKLSDFLNEMGLKFHSIKRFHVNPDTREKVECYDSNKRDPFYYGVYFENDKSEVICLFDFFNLEISRPCPRGLDATIFKFIFCKYCEFLIMKEIDLVEGIEISYDIDRDIIDMEIPKFRTFGNETTKLPLKTLFTFPISSAVDDERYDIENVFYYKFTNTILKRMKTVKKDLDKIIYQMNRIIELYKKYN